MGILLVLEVFGHKLNVTEVIACLKGTLMWTHANPSAMFRYCTVQCQICWKRWITKPRTHLLETITVLTEFTLIRPIVYMFQPRLKQRTDSQAHVSICKAKQEAWLKMSSTKQEVRFCYVLFIYSESVNSSKTGSTPDGTKRSWKQQGALRLLEVTNYTEPCCSVHHACTA